MSAGYQILATKNLLKAVPLEPFPRLRRALPALVGGAGGVAFNAIVGGAHPALSALLGAAVVKNGIDLATGEATLPEAGKRMRTHAIGACGSLALPMLPMVGYGLGVVADNLVFGASWDPAPSIDDVLAGKAPLLKGQKGQAVSYIQRALGIKEDGKFGDETETAVKAFQARELPDQFANGVVGDITFKAIMANGPGSNARTPTGDSHTHASTPAPPLTPVSHETPGGHQDAPVYMTAPQEGFLTTLKKPLWQGSSIRVWQGGLLGLAAALALGAGVAYMVPTKPVVA